MSSSSSSNKAPKDGGMKKPGKSPGEQAIMTQVALQSKALSRLHFHHFHPFLTSAIPIKESPFVLGPSSLVQFMELEIKIVEAELKDISLVYNPIQSPVTWYHMLMIELLRPGSTGEWWPVSQLSCSRPAMYDKKQLQFEPSPSKKKQFWTRADKFFKYLTREDISRFTQLTEHGTIINLPPKLLPPQLVPRWSTRSDFKVVHSSIPNICLEDNEITAEAYYTSQKHAEMTRKSMLQKKKLTVAFIPSLLHQNKYQEFRKVAQKIEADFEKTKKSKTKRKR